MSAPRFSKSATHHSEDRQSPWYNVHVARYLFSLPYVKNKRVLDIACGTGYGLPLLQQEALEVVGADLDLEAAKIARAELRDGSGKIVLADARQLPFKNGSFDVITSFETLEHMERRDRFLAELARVLPATGVCILSTPNAKQTLPINGKPRNPFHVHEYEPEELRSELAHYFSSVRLLGQELNPRFAIPPFWDEQERLSKQPGMRKRILFWRALNKLPSNRLRDEVSLALWGHKFLPDENDYEFNESMVEQAPVLIALCSNARET